MDKAAFFARYSPAASVTIVTLPDGDQVHIRAMTAKAADLVEQAYTRTPSMMRATLMRWSICDAEGALVFSDADLPQLADLPAGIARVICEAAHDLNGLSPQAVSATQGE